MAKNKKPNSRQKQLAKAKLRALQSAQAGILSSKPTVSRAAKSRVSKPVVQKPAPELEMAVSVPLLPVRLPKATSVVEVSPHSTWHLLLSRARHGIETARFGKLFALGCLLILLATTTFWTVLSARLHQANADQLIDAYLFESQKTFTHATFPGAHSFLVKWPFFALMHLFGNSPQVFLGATLLMVLVTIGALVYLLYKIEGRPVIFGLLCLALSSILLLVPTQPYAGTLLPVNMAMTTTRNLEYALYLLVLYYAVHLTRLKSIVFIGLIALVGLLVASDKLFAALAIGGGIVAFCWYAGFLRRRVEADYILRWMLLVVIGVVVSSVLLRWLNSFGITHIESDQIASPFQLIHSLRQFAIGLIYAIAGLVTNFGANPAHATIIVRQLPAAVLSSFRHLSIIAYIVNLVLLGAGLYASFRLLRVKVTDAWSRLSVLLLGSTLSAGAVYVLTDHYYPVDARYLTIGLFALFIAAASYLRRVTLRTNHILASGFILLAVVPLGLLTSWHEYLADSTALAGRNHVTNQVSEALQRNHISRLVGDYWDVTPVKATTIVPLTIVPVDRCNVPRQALSSTAWSDSSAKIPTAYLAVRDGSPTAGPDAVPASAGPTYGGCSLAHIVGSYGVPSERVSISQTNMPDSSKDALLLLYDKGFQSEPANTPAKLAAVAAAEAAKIIAATPPEIQSLASFTERGTACTKGTSLQVVAHQDDDILFMNPDVLNSIKGGQCIRTVYLTAGDAGEGVSYWGGRENGAKAAYAQMFGVPNDWHETQQILAGHKVNVEYLAAKPQVSLVFLRLPDGNLHGEGFAADKYESLSSLMTDSINVIHAVDGSTSYTKQQLIDTLHEVMVTDLPSQIRTQGSSNLQDGDHSDHHNAGLFTVLAASNYLQAHTLTHYLGYPEKEYPVNLSDDVITIKEQIFLTYAKFDGAVCQSAFECQNTTTYGKYLFRQYQPS